MIQFFLVKISYLVRPASYFWPELHLSEDGVSIYKNVDRHSSLLGQKAIFSAPTLEPCRHHIEAEKTYTLSLAPSLWYCVDEVLPRMDYWKLRLYLENSNQTFVQEPPKDLFWRYVVMNAPDQKHFVRRIIIKRNVLHGVLELVRSREATIGCILVRDVQKNALPFKMSLHGPMEGNTELKRWSQLGVLTTFI
ncbi:hypothetical protein [Aestuariivirga sp.]|uniref:hypothetical protein n=1 Tax=Aestuariivirga sp. TaxID=2650926 RepID=UPI0039E57DB7